MFKHVVAPYSRFAKIAKASELVPYTEEWGQMTDLEKAEILFGKHTEGALDRFRKLPKAIKDFEPPADIERFEAGTLQCERVLSRLEEHGRYLRQLFAARDAGGERVQESLLIALNPSAFNMEASRAISASRRALKVRNIPTIRVYVELRRSQLRKLRDIFNLQEERELVMAAVAFAIKALKKQHRARLGGRAAR